VSSRIGATPRTTVKRLPEKAVREEAQLDAILAAGLVAHVSVVDDGQPLVIPIAYARVGDELLLHGSSASRAFRLLASGAPTCATITLLDGLVLARSAFESSMNYRSVMILGRARGIEGDERIAALQAISDHLLPGRWPDIRPPSPRELKATAVVALPLAECSIKISAGGPDDVPEDLVDPVYSRTWAGVVPIREVFEQPQPDDLSADADVPDYVLGWTRA
jgi:uncharacterized protein